MEFCEWFSTKEALIRLKESLNCGLCSELLQEPCSLGSCDHLFCRNCIGDHVGNSCPKCQAPAWAKDLQVKRELANVVKLYHKMCLLIETSSSKESQCNAVDSVEDTSQDEPMCESADADSIQIKLHLTNDDISTNKGLVHPKSEDSQQGPAKQNVKKVVKTVVGKHGKLSCILKVVSNVDKEEENAIKNNISAIKQKVSATKRKVSAITSKNMTKSMKARFHRESFNNSDCITEYLTNLGTVEETDSIAVYDFIASPSRPKPVKKKRIIRKVDPKVLRARRLADANKKWNKVSKLTKRRYNQKVGGRHVSFREETDSDTRITSEYSASIESMDTGSDSMWDDVDSEDDEQNKTCKGPVTRVNHSSAVSKTNVTLPMPTLSDTQSINDNSTCTSGTTHNSGLTKCNVKKEKSIMKSMSGLATSPMQKGNAESPKENKKSMSPGRNSAKRNIRGETPLHIAAIKGETAVVEELLKEGDDPNVKDNAGWMPLHEACNHGHVSCVALLLDHGALINAPGFEHDSPLHDAVTNGHVDVVKLLMERGADLNVRNMHGLAPGDYACSDVLNAALNTKQLVTNSPLTILKTQLFMNRPPIFLATGLSKSHRVKLDSCAKLLKGRIISQFSPEVTHLVAACDAHSVCMRTSKYLQAILMGKWVVNFTWVAECLKKKQRVDEEPHEVPGTTAHPTSAGPRRGRENILNQLPGLFDGCNFFFYGTFKPPTPSKSDLSELIKSGGGVTVQRQPKPDDDVIQASTTVPYHAKQNSQLSNCSYFIIYDQTTTRVPPKVNTGKVRTASVHWLMNCISNFALMDLTE